MISEFLEVGTFAPHWRSGVMVFVGLIASKIAYNAKVSYTRKKQDKALKRAENGARARITLRIAHQVDDVLSTALNNIDATSKLADIWISNGQCFEDQAIRRRLASPPVFSIAPQLDKLGIETAKTYLQLCDKISEFRTSMAGTGSTRLHNELQVLHKFVLLLQEKISEVRRQAQSALAEGPTTLRW